MLLFLVVDAPEVRAGHKAPPLVVFDNGLAQADFVMVDVIAM